MLKRPNAFKIPKIIRTFAPQIELKIKIQNR